MSRRITVVTGTSRGIGRYLVEKYLERGDAVIGCSRSAPAVRHVAYTHHQLDVSDERAVTAMFRAVRKRFGYIDVLVNNAGIAAMNHVLLTPGATAERLLRTNVLGAFLCCREAARLMRRSTSPRIINFSTVAVPLALEGEAIYAASKAAIETLTRVMARELAGLNITVNAVGPTAVDTALLHGVPEGKIAQLLARQAIARKGTFDDVINAVEFFASPASGLVTGQVLYLGGAL